MNVVLTNLDESPLSNEEIRFLYQKTREKDFTWEKFIEVLLVVVLHGNGEDIYFLISPTLPISPSPHLPISPSPHTPGASFTITMHHHLISNLGIGE